MFNRWLLRVYKTLITKMMNVLNKHFHFTQHFTLLDFSTSFLFSLHFISDKGLTKNCNERAVA
ncbi:MAG: hypothetical protein ACD_62C00080G0001 [uncultured bacterium]|nr:MAG: hypothetical protein ACD_62C00080G0001 [uncultured bacterium]